MIIKGAPNLLLGIVPGAFYHEYPRSGADGARILEAAASLCIKAERIPLPSFCSVKESAREISIWLKRHAGRRIILVSLSKGSLDTAELFLNPELREAVKPVACWLSVSGIIGGTPLTEWFFRRPLRMFFIRLLFRRRGYRVSDLADLAYCPERIDALRQALPAELRMIHVVGLPERHHLSCRLARRSYRRLLPLGANDGGGVLLHDLASLPGCVYPVYGQDHYLKQLDIKSLLLRVLSDLEMNDFEKQLSIEDTGATGRFEYC